MAARGAALVTGASSGIGFWLAGLFARDGHDLVLVARAEGRLRALADALASRYGVRATVLPVDLALPEAPARLAAALADRDLPIEFLVNNAGIGARGPFQELPVDDQLRILQVNVVSLTHLTRLLLPAMVARGHGGVLNVASTAAFFPGPLMAVYYASKAYVLSFSRALQVELRGSGVQVTALCPGPTRTEFQARAGMGDSNLARGPLLMDALPVARAGYRGLRRGDAVVVPGPFNQATALFARLAPSGLAARVVRALNARQSH